MTEVLQELAALLPSNESVDVVVSRVCSLAVGVLDGADLAGVCLHDGERSTTIGHTDPVVLQLEKLQREVNEGPCLQSLDQQGADGHLHDIGATDVDDQWPRFSSGIASLGIGSMLSVRLFAGQGALGALNLYGRKPFAFRRDDHPIAFIFAAHAALALADSRALSRVRETERIRRSLAAQEIIGRAKGILMERERISNEAAFDILREISQRSNVKLRQVAKRIVDAAEEQALRERK